MGGMWGGTAPRSGVRRALDGAMGSRRADAAYLTFEFVTGVVSAGPRWLWGRLSRH